MACRVVEEFTGGSGQSGAGSGLFDGGEGGQSGAGSGLFDGVGTCWALGPGQNGFTGNNH